MQVAGDPEALILRGHAGKLRPRFGERVIAAQQLKGDECHDRDDRDRDRDEIAERGAQAVMPRGNGHRDQERPQGQRQDGGRGPGTPPGHSEHRDEQAHDERRGAGEWQLSRKQHDEDAVEGPESP